MRVLRLINFFLPLVDALNRTVVTVTIPPTSVFYDRRIEFSVGADQASRFGNWLEGIPKCVTNVWYSRESPIDEFTPRASITFDINDTEHIIAGVTDGVGGPDDLSDCTFLTESLSKFSECAMQYSSVNIEGVPVGLTSVFSGATVCHPGWRPENMAMTILGPIFLFCLVALCTYSHYHPGNAQQGGPLNAAGAAAVPPLVTQNPRHNPHRYIELTESATHPQDDSTTSNTTITVTL